MNSTNYVTILGWMKTGLGLKGNELLTYALLHGFCQAKNGARLSLDYISDWLGTTRRGTINIINRLKEKGLITAKGKQGRPKTYRLSATKISEAIRKAKEEEQKARERKTTPETSEKPADSVGLSTIEREAGRTGKGEDVLTPEESERRRQLRKIILETHWLQND